MHTRPTVPRIDIEPPHGARVYCAPQCGTPASRLIVKARDVDGMTVSSIEDVPPKVVRRFEWS